MDIIFGIEDFTLRKEDAENKMFISYKEYIVSNKKVIDSDSINYCLLIYLQKDNELSDCISNINAYIKWLNGEDCKNRLIKYFCDFFNEKIKISKGKYINVNKKIEDKWYENLKVWKASITIDKNKVFASKIICKDDKCKKNEILLLSVKEDNFCGIEYKNIGDIWI